MEENGENDDGKTSEPKDDDRGGDGGGDGGGHTESKMNPATAPVVGFLALCMSHFSGHNWPQQKQRHGRKFRDAMRIVQLEGLVRMKVSHCCCLVARGLRLATLLLVS